MIGVMVPNVSAHILEPKVLFQDEHIKILDGGIAYSNIGLTDSGGGAGYGAVWTDSVIYFQIQNVSNNAIEGIPILISTYDHKEQLLEERTSYFYKDLLPNESGFMFWWMNMRGWSCVEMSINSDGKTIDSSKRVISGYTILSPEELTEDQEMGFFNHDLEIIELNDNGKGMFTGYVKNLGEKKKSDVFVQLIKFDSDDKIISILYDEIGSISPNKSKKFEISAYMIGNTDNSEKSEIFYREPHHVEVFAQNFVSSSKYFNSGDFHAVGNKNYAEVGSCTENKLSVPTWIKNNAGWWAEGQIDDNSFVQGIEYLVKVGIIQVS